MRLIVLLFGCLAGCGAQSGELYRWIDANGKVHYGEKPSADAAQVEARKFPGADSSGAYLSFETRRARQNFPVTLYVADNCKEYCDQARQLLSKRGIPYSEKSLKTQKEFDEFNKLSGSSNIPTLGVGKVFLQGLNAGQWHSELDAAGYPKSTIFIPPPPLPALTPAPSSGAAPANP